MNAVLHVLFRFLEIIFFIGIVGSLLVIVITTVEDLVILFEKDEPAHETTESVANAMTLSAER
jgi:hypothetical protein